MSRPSSVSIPVWVSFVMLPSAVGAGTRFDLTPSLAVAEAYDSNVFFGTSKKEDDWITRVTPVLEARCTSRLFSAGARYSLDAEVFSKHSELTSIEARQEAQGDLAWHPTRSVTISAGATFTKTQTPGELNLTTGFHLGRMDARRLAATPSMGWKLGARSTATAEYSFTRDSFTRGPILDVHGLSLTFDRRGTPREVHTLGYAFHAYALPEGRRSTSHTLIVGWSLRMSRRTRFEIKTGPRLSGRDVGAELSLEVSRRSRSGEMSVSGAQTETTAIGLTGAVITQSVGIRLSQRLRRALSVTAAPAAYRSRGSGFEATVGRLAVGLDWRLASWLSLSAADELSLQRTRLGDRDAGELRRHVVVLGLAAAPSR